MKKILALALALVLAFALAIPAFAAEETANVIGSAPADGALSGDSEGSVVTYNVAGSYIVSVPVGISADAGAEDAQLKISGLMLFYDTQLTVSITYDGELSVTDATEADNISYKLQFKAEGENYTDITKDVAFVTVEAGNNAEVTKNIKAVLLDSPIYAGVYTENVTFNVSIS